MLNFTEIYTVWAAYLLSMPYWYYHTRAWSRWHIHCWNISPVETQKTRFVEYINLVPGGHLTMKAFLEQERNKNITDPS